MFPCLNLINCWSSSPRLIRLHGFDRSPPRIAIITTQWSMCPDLASFFSVTFVQHPEAKQQIKVRREWFGFKCKNRNQGRIDRPHFSLSVIAWFVDWWPRSQHLDSAFFLDEGTNLSDIHSALPAFPFQCTLDDANATKKWQKQEQRSKWSFYQDGGGFFLLKGRCLQHAWIELSFSEENEGRD